MKKGQRNNDLQITSQRMSNKKPIKTRVNSGTPEVSAVRVLLGATVFYEFPWTLIWYHVYIYYQIYIKQNTNFEQMIPMDIPDLGRNNVDN